MKTITHESCGIFCLNASWKRNVLQRRIIQRFVVCLMLFVAGTLYAQSISSTITGVVVDPQGAVISNAKITANNVSKNVLLSTNTDEQGRFAFAQIEPGSYKITIEAQALLDAFDGHADVVDLADHAVFTEAWMNFTISRALMTLEYAVGFTARARARPR